MSAAARPFLGSVFGFGLIITAMGIGVPIANFFDLSAVLCVPLCVLAFTAAYHSPAAIGAALSAAYGNTGAKADDVDHYQVLQNARRIAHHAGAAGLMVGLVSVLRFASDPSAIGPYAALGLLSLLYAMLIAECVIGPLCSKLRRRSGATGNWVSPRTSALYLGMIGVYGTMSCLYLLTLSFSAYGLNG